MQSVNNDAKAASGGGTKAAPAPKTTEKSQSFVAGIMDFIKPDNDIFKEMGMTMPTKPVVIHDDDVAEIPIRPTPVKKLAEK